MAECDTREVWVVIHSLDTKCPTIKPIVQMLALGENEDQIELEIKKKLSSLEIKLAETKILKLIAKECYYDDIMVMCSNKPGSKTLEINIDATMTIAQLAKAIGEVC